MIASILKLWKTSMLTTNTIINLDGDGRQEVSRLAAEFDPHNLEDTTLTWLYTWPPGESMTLHSKLAFL